MATKTDICNIALGLLGVSERVQSIDDASVAAQALKLNYGTALDEALRSRDWNFARKRAELVLDATAPLFDYLYAYLLPQDYVMAREFNGRLAGTSMANWEISGRLILSNETCSRLRYTYRNETTSEYAADFVQAFARLLASAVGSALSTAPSLSIGLRQEAGEIGAQATGMNAQESRVRAVRAETDSQWLAARFGFGGLRRRLPTQPTPEQWPDPL